MNKPNQVRELLENAVPHLKRNPDSRRLVVSAWNGFFAPKKTPAAVINLLNEHLNAILREPEVVEKLAVFGALPAGGSPKVLSDLNQREYMVMGQAIKELGIVAE